MSSHATGARARTRERIGARIVGSTYLERWLVIDARIENHGVDKITFRCDPRRPTVQVPAVGSRVRWEFMQLPGENPEDVVARGDDRALLAPFVETGRKSRSSARPSTPFTRGSRTVGAQAAFFWPATPPI